MASRLKDELSINKNNEIEELLVFGYSCKLFRDDEKALYIDQGKHLIPWMGDESLKIDRYDARGTLYDLRQAEAPSGGFDQFFGLTDLEKQVESMCDEERYRALVTNEEDETLYQEEELKRLHYAINDKKNSYGQVEYNYDGEVVDMKENNEEKITEKSADDTNDDEPFVPSPQLDLPVNMIVPETNKHNAIIEKTALFISNQGPQMEILLKMKQAGNPQFNFLSFDNPLHNYYRHLLMAIKNGCYKPELSEGSYKKSDVEQDDDDDHYLHPSLASSVSKVELAPSIPSINYKPSAHCAYSMLVNKIQDKKSKEQGTPLHKLKEAFEKLNDKKSGEENKSLLQNCSYPNSQFAQTPPNDMQLIIDKMASYVAKNGRDFEDVVRKKNDPRFDFLNSSHIYNGYYQCKLKQYESLEKISKHDSKTKQETLNMKLKDDLKGKLTPVCFSIKKPKDSEPVIEKSALPVEESSDEEGKNEKKGKENKEEKQIKEEIVTIDLAAQEEKEEKNKKILATERLKDRLTAAAREKVAMASKEKQLQLDRKRRAAVFLQKIHPEPIPKGAIVYGPQLPDRIEDFDRDLEVGSDVDSLPEAADSFSDERVKKMKSSDRHKLSRSSRHGSDKKHKSSNSGVRHKHREKHRSRSDKIDKFIGEESRARDIHDRISESSISSTDEENKRRGSHGSKSKRSEDGNGSSQWKGKSDRNRDSRKEEKRHKRKKHKRNDMDDRSCRKHSNEKKRRSRESDGSRNSRSKRSRTNSSTSSDNPNS